MGFLGNILSAAAKVVTSPLAMADDVLKVLDGDTPDSTVKQLGSAAEDLEKGIDDLI